MTVQLLKELAQGKFLGDKGYSSGGVCYYICEYVQEKVWCRPAAGSFDNAVAIARDVVPYSLIKAGKAKNLAQKGGRAIPQRNYPALITPLNPNSLYRVGLWFGTQAEVPINAGDQNHEAIVITGAGAEIVFLEPNWGFYQGDADLVNITNKAVLEAGVRELYVNHDNHHAENFHYERIRGL